MLFINIQRLRWLGLAVRVKKDDPARLLFDLGSAEVNEETTLCSLEETNRENPVID